MDLNFELWQRQPIASRRYKGDLPADFSNPHKGGTVIYHSIILLVTRTKVIIYDNLQWGFDFLIFAGAIIMDVILAMVFEEARATVRTAAHRGEVST